MLLKCNTATCNTAKCNTAKCSTATCNTAKCNEYPCRPCNTPMDIEICMDIHTYIDNYIMHNDSHVVNSPMNSKKLTHDTIINTHAN